MGAVARVSYPETGNQESLALEESSFWFAHRNRCIEALVDNFPPRGPIVDVGGGNGFVSMGLMRAGHDVVLVEPGEDGAAAARARGIRDVRCSTFEGADFTDASLSAVGLFDVLEHVEKESDFLELMRQKLVAGGRLYVTVPAYNFLWSVEDDYAGHFRRYSRVRLRDALERSGFALDFVSYIFWFLPIPILVFRALPSRTGIVREASVERTQAEHSERQGFRGRLVDALLRREANAIQNGKRVPFGGSIIAAARVTESK